LEIKGIRRKNILKALKKSTVFGIRKSFQRHGLNHGSSILKGTGTAEEKHGSIAGTPRRFSRL